MKQFWLTLLVATLIATPLAAQTPGATPTPEPPKTPKDQESYSIGLNIGKSLQGDGIDSQLVNPLMVARGIIDALTGAKPALSEAEVMAAMQRFQQTMLAKQRELQAQQQQMGEKAKAAGDAFLAANAKKPGVKVLPSGLQYRIVKAGNGASPGQADTVKVHYHGTLTNGDVFDSSVERGEPIEFPVNGVIPGWTEALQLMKPGDKWQLVIPAKLAYGERGAPPRIPPNSVLVFDVELLEVK